MYPALAVLQTLQNKYQDQLEVIWVGAEGAMESDLMTQVGVPFQTIPASGLHGVNLLKLPGNLWRLTKGFFAAKKLIQDFKPDVIFYTGGYVAAPIGLAGRKLPVVAYVPDVEPALALQLGIRFADRVAVSIENSKPFIQQGKQVVVTGYPVREELVQAKTAGKQACIEAFNLSSDKPILLVTGGSLGARSINQAIIEKLPELLEFVQIIHIFGKTTYEEFAAQRAALTESQKKNYRAYSYLHSQEMAQALAAADLCVSRGGASTLGEYPFMGLPAIIVPYPHAWRYQKTNAESLASHGGAIVLEDGKLKQSLFEQIKSILEDQSKLSEMKKSMEALAEPNAAKNIANVITSLVQGWEEE